MKKVVMSGRAGCESEIFDFKLGPWCDGIGLMVRNTGAGDKSFNGAGIWPSIEKAKSIADEIAKRALGPDCLTIRTEVED